MIYTGDNEILGVRLGDTDINAIYAGDLLLYPTTVTGWSVNPTSFEVKRQPGSVNIRITSLEPWTIASSESWVTLSQNSGDSGRTTVVATYTENTGDSARTATITVTDGTNTSTVSLQQNICSPLVLVNNLNNTNNNGKNYGSNFYLFDSGLTSISPCDFDFTGIKSICARRDAFYEVTPVAAIGTNNDGCKNTIENFEADCSTVEVLHYCFGADNEGAVSQTLTSVTLHNTDNVRHIGDFCYYNRNLKEVHLGNLSNVTYFESNCFNASNVSLTGFTVDALPNINLNVGWQYCPLSVDSLVNIFNALPTASASRTVDIGTTNKNKLSAAQLAIATDKGWTVN